MNKAHLLEDLKWRYATKLFDANKTIEKPLLVELMEAVRLAPSSYGLQPWKFIVISDSQLRKELLPHAYNQSQIVDASHVVVLCLKKNFGEEDVDRFVQDMIETRNIQKDDLMGYRNMMVQTVSGMSLEQRTHWMQKQVYLALGFLLAQAAHLHIDACPMEGFVPHEFDRILGLEDYQTTVVCAIGYRSKDDKYAQAAKVRYSADEVIQWR